jgi:hypothetical protein
VTDALATLERLPPMSPVQKDVLDEFWPRKYGSPVPNDNQPGHTRVSHRTTASPA